MDEFIRELAKKAGTVLLKNFKKDKELIGLRSTSKEAVTKYDKSVDKLLIRTIKKNYPYHSVLSEESGLLGGNNDYLWIVDSLDGTSNFANGNPLFSVCIALMEKNEITLGVVHAPAIGEFYFAKKGGGAYLGDKRIKVSDVSDLSQSYVLYCEGGDKSRTKAEKIIERVYPKVTDLRKIGSAGIETAWVAAGKADAYFTTEIDPWDIAPGLLLVKEAGGEVSDFMGNPWQPVKSDLLFSNKLLHKNAMELLL